MNNFASITKYIFSWIKERYFKESCYLNRIDSLHNDAKTFYDKELMQGSKLWHEDSHVPRAGKVTPNGARSNTFLASHCFITVY